MITAERVKPKSVKLRLWADWILPPQPRPKPWSAGAPSGPKTPVYIGIYSVSLHVHDVRHLTIFLSVTVLNL